ncbi:hypothetical protein GRI75_06165 [Altererythrobacter soli]|uniref:PilZ domain-containing protein n=2 Tax=Croceibacterium soli TaxID=1739690 RepID=A0A6I4UUR4_9SPHN|nr:hypothetical protein [Croceibacterium soli]
MFVLATMSAPAVSGSVKIRNMSLHGALIEGDALPGVGESLRLRRGELTVAGRIVWRNAGRAGLRFEQDVEVSRWLPTGGSGQPQVDRTFHDLKSGTAEPAPQTAAEFKAPPAGPGDALKVADALDALADALSEDAGVVASHASRLQALDIASQLLRRFAATGP